MTHVNLFAKVGHVRRPKQSVPSVMIVSRASNPTAVPVKDPVGRGEYCQAQFQLASSVPVELRFVL